MFLHTNPTLSRIFQRQVESNLQEYRPMLITGPIGVGKFSYVQSFIRSLTDCKDWKPFNNDFRENRKFMVDCKCTSCQKILQNKAHDVRALRGREKIADFKEQVQDFVNHNPVELDHRWLVIRNLSLLSPDTLNTFLKILEEPYPYLKIIATTSRLDGIPGAILSRFHTFPMDPLSQEDLEIIVKGSPTLQPFVSLLNKYEFTSVDQIVIYRKLLFDDAFTNFFVKPNNIALLARDVSEFLKTAKKDPNYRYEDIITFFLNFFVDQVNSFCEINDTPNLKLFKPYFKRIVKNYSVTLFRYLQSPINYYYMNVDNQIFSFISAVYSLKVLTHA